ncbi:MAG TPA: outer membrane protein assembly factor BamE [Steroidobacteraceae bacterium]|nr:outer membrane protein assembly factor BamE [Steroidobacteraceae bacterium]
MLSSGCVYKMSIQQGNYLVPDSVAQLKEGMTRSQVRFLLGTPMVPDAFDDSRWDYYYSFTSQKIRQPLKRRLTIYFEDERVSRFENQGVPTQADLAQLEKDLKRAIEDSKLKKQPNALKRMFSKDKPLPAETTKPEPGPGESATTPAAEPAPTTTAPAPGATTPSGTESSERPPDPVPPSQPLPAPAGSPSGPP